MKTIKITLSLFLLIVLFSNRIIAQEKSNTTPLIDKFSVGLNFGSLLSYCDVKEYNFWPTPDERKWGFGGDVNFQVSPILSFQAQGIAGKLAGIKRHFIGGAPANLKFNAEIYEGSLNATISLNRWWAPNLKINDKVNFYGIAGIGLITFRSQLRGLYDDKFIRDFGYSDNGTVKDKMTTETVFPVGLGIKYKATKKIDIVLETTLRNVITDKLDAYVTGNSLARDKYGYTFVGISYKFGKQEQHMEWILPKEDVNADDKLAFDGLNKKIDSLMNKNAAQSNVNDPRFAELNQKIDDLTKKVIDLENKAPVAVTNPIEGGNIDSQRLAELNQKLADLDNKNKELGNKIINMQSTTINYEGGKAILVSVFFDVNKSNIDKANGERVAAAAKYMQSDPSVKIELIGNADKTGGQKYNDLLSERRSKAVQKVLIDEYGIDPSRLSISYKGFSEPLSKTNYDINRRVDFIIK